MKIRKQTKLWITRDGRRIRICDMEPRHLTSTIKMIVRNMSFKMLALALNAYQYAATAPDGASMAAEREADMIMDDAANHNYTVYCRHWPYLLKEAERRSITLHYTDGMLISKVICLAKSGEQL